jgi:hemerythrin-like domain-containing protein
MAMRASRILKEDQDLVGRFLAVLGRGLVIASRSKSARPAFFVVASNFIHEFVEPQYLEKESVLLRALEECGFPSDSGPVGNMRAQHAKSREIAQMLSEAARAWQAGDDTGRAEVVWATSEYTDLMRHHFERLRNLVNPLLEQSVTEEGELKIAEDLNRISFADRAVEAPDKYEKMLKLLEDEVRDWEG